MFNRTGASAGELAAVRYNDAGVNQEYKGIAVITFASLSALIVGCTCAADGRTISAWTEPSGGGTRVEHGSQTLDESTRDANHTSVGFFDENPGTSSKYFLFQLAANPIAPEGSGKVVTHATLDDITRFT